MTKVNNPLIYIKLKEPWHRVPFLKQESIDKYFEFNVKPHQGTSYGEVERRHWQELKAAHKAGCDLAAITDIEEVPVYG